MKLYYPENLFFRIIPVYTIILRQSSAHPYKHTHADIVYNTFIIQTHDNNPLLLIIDRVFGSGARIQYSKRPRAKVFVATARVVGICKHLDLGPPSQLYIISYWPYPLHGV